jgi:hypothetical protein
MLIRQTDSAVETGSGGWTRTNNQRINSPLRYQLRYAGARRKDRIFQITTGLVKHPEIIPITDSGQVLADNPHVFP